MVKQIVKIGSVDLEIIGLQVFIKKRINASKTYSPPYKFAGWAKKIDF